MQGPSVCRMLVSERTQHNQCNDGSVADNGGSNPVSGYGLFEAAGLDDAIAKARGCPILADGGSVELAEALDM